MPHAGSARPRRARVASLLLATFLLAPLAVIATAQSASAAPPPSTILVPQPVLEPATLVVVPIPDASVGDTQLTVTIRNSATDDVLATTNETVRSGVSVNLQIPGSKMIPSLTAIRVQLDFEAAQDARDFTFSMPVTYLPTPATLTLVADSVPAYTNGTAQATLMTANGKLVPDWPVKFGAPGMGVGPTVNTNAAGVASVPFRSPAGSGDVQAIVEFAGPFIVMPSNVVTISISRRTETWDAPARVSGAMTQMLSTSVGFGATMPPEAVGDTVEVWRGDTFLTWASVVDATDPRADLMIAPPAAPGLEILELRYVSRTSPASIKISPHHLSVVWSVTHSSVVLDPIPNNLRPGDSITLRASVSDETGPLEVGAVKFSVDGLTYIRGLSGGEATVEMSNLIAGRHDVVATYLPVSENTVESADSTSFQVSPIAVSVTGVLSAPTAVVGDDITYDVVVSEEVEAPPVNRALPRSSAPEGTVTLLINGQPVGDPVTLALGAATLAVPTDVAGTYTVSARFTPARDAWFAAESAQAATLIVSTAPVDPPVDPPVKPGVKPVPPAAPQELASTGSEVSSVLLLAIGFMLFAGVRLTRRRRSA